MNQPFAVRILAAAGVGYESARAWQAATAAEVRAARDLPPGGIHTDPAEALALIEHAPVYSMGARGGRASVRLPLEALPAPLVDTDRGGDITWHGPGQLVAYPILDLRRRGLGVAAYIEALEGMLLDTLAAFGIAAGLVEGRRGIWVAGDKIAALGIRVQGGVSLHGIALNVSPDLGWFDAIVPCGLEDAGVTSMSRVLGRTVRVAEARKAMMRSFERRFDARLVTVACEAATDALAGREQVSA
ncbi:MAG: lipoyl(octanoyl) transferase LipB [Chloroflexi bacterium]|nr:lipoyl(octanoyl) transferase LipB [Chloroflexota bacterium]